MGPNHSLNISLDLNFKPGGFKVIRMYNLTTLFKINFWLIAIPRYNNNLKFRRNSQLWTWAWRSSWRIESLFCSLLGLGPTHLVGDAKGRDEWLLSTCHTERSPTTREGISQSHHGWLPKKVKVLEPSVGGAMGKRQGCAYYLRRWCWQWRWCLKMVSILLYSKIVSWASPRMFLKGNAYGGKQLETT